MAELYVYFIIVLGTAFIILLLLFLKAYSTLLDERIRELEKED